MCIRDRAHSAAEATRLVGISRSAFYKYKDCVYAYSCLLYTSIRDLTEKNLEDALRQASEIGYRNVEFAGFFGHSAEEVAAMLRRYGLTTSGTHTGWDAILQNPEEIAEYHKAIGTNHIIIPGTDLWSRKTMDAFVANVNDCLLYTSIVEVIQDRSNQHLKCGGG